MDTNASEPKQGGFGATAEELARIITFFAGSTTGFLLAVGTVAVWGITGPLFGYSDTWQLVINTGTTVITFLMVFLIQRAQNKDSLSIQLKLNEIVAAVQGASNRLISAEDLTENELRRMDEHYKHLAETAKKDHDIGRSHSVEEEQHEPTDKPTTPRR